jgi:hypothetical protein
VMCHQIRGPRSGPRIRTGTGVLFTIQSKRKLLVLALYSKLGQKPPDLHVTVVTPDEYVTDDDEILPMNHLMISL